MRSNYFSFLLVIVEERWFLVVFFLCETSLVMHFNDLICESKLNANCANYYIETGMCIATNFSPIVQITSVNDNQLEQICLTPSRWFLIMKREFGNLFKFFGLKQLKISEENTVFIDERMILRFNNDNSAMLIDGEFKLSITKELFHELVRWYDSVTLKLEFLNKYQIIAIKIYSRYVNYFIKKNNEDISNEFEIDNISSHELPQIDNLSLDYSNFDELICKNIFSEIRLLAHQKLFHEVEFIKTFYSQSWINSNYLVM